MLEIDLAEIRRTILARTVGAETEPPRGAERAALLQKKRQADARLLAAEFAKFGGDVGAIDRALGANQRSYLEGVRRLRDTESEDVAARKTALELAAEQRLPLLDLPNLPWFPFPSITVMLPAPLAITQTPADAGILLESTIAPNDSRAKVNATGNVSANRSVDFWYFYVIENPHGALFSVSAPLMLNGNVLAECASGGLFGNEYLDFEMVARVQVYDQADTNPPHIGWQIAYAPIMDINLAANFLSSGHSAEHQFTNEMHGATGSIPLKQGGVLIKVSVSISVSFQGHGSSGDDDNNPGNELWCDFATDRLGYFIQSPFIKLDVTNFNPLGAAS
jgi:hypothetical protein